MPAAPPFVFIVGSPRSGTTVLGDILDCHGAVRQWYEPYFIWDRFHRLAPDDGRTEADATDRVRAWIRARFEGYRTSLGAAVVVDKSPRNSLKLPFIQAIFPDAAFIHILRDGRDATLSIHREWRRRRAALQGEDTGRPVPGRVAGTLRSWLARQPRWVDRFRALAHELGPTPWNPATHLHRLRWDGAVGWGPRFPGWREAFGHVSELRFNAMQWAACVSGVLDGWEDIPPERRMVLRYEDMLDDPEGELGRCLGVMGLEPDDGFFGRIPRLKAGNYGKWHDGFTADQKADIAPVLDPVLARLGYGNGRD